MCGRGDVNTYAIFAELIRGAVGATGRAGVIVPTGIATDDTTKLYFQNIIERGSLVSLYDFENREAVFPGVHRSYKFCLLTLTGHDRPAADGATFVFFATQTDQLDDPERRFTLSAEDIALLNPNTRTCPVFRTRRDAELTKAIYRRVPVLVHKDQQGRNHWRVTLARMFHMSDDARLFRTRDQLESEGCRLNGNVFGSGPDRWIPLYEAKMLHQFDHRWATYDGPDTRDLTDAEKREVSCVVMPRYWVPGAELDTHLTSPWGYQWLCGWRRSARNTDERTMIATPIGRVALGDSVFLLLPDEAPATVTVLLSALNSFVLDYTARQKVGGANMSYYLVEQFPVVAPEDCASASDFVAPRVLELTYASTDLAPLARDLGHDGPPFRWDPDRRALIRAELDAAMFRLYGIERADVDYIMDTFPIVRRKDEQRFGEYRTKRLILERYDAMVAAEADGREYDTPLDPPPGDPRAAHPSLDRAGAA